MERHPFAGPLDVGGVIRFTELEEESLFVRQHSSPAVKLKINMTRVSVRLSLSWNSFLMCVTGE